MEKNEIISLLGQFDDFSVLQESIDPILKKRGLDLGYELSCRIEDLQIKVLIGFDPHFPRHKPSYFLQPLNALGHIPHIETDGWICYSHDDYLFMDAENPAGVIAGTFALARKTLQDGYLGKNEIDFLNEFESYWKRLEGCREVYANLSIGDEVKKIKIAKRGKLVFAVDDDAAPIEIIRRFLGDANHSAPLSNGIHVPLEKGAKFFPPAYDHQYSIQEIYSFIFNNISDANKKILAKLCEDKTKRDHYIFFSFQQPNGNYAFGGFKFFNLKGYKHPFMNLTNEYKIEPIYIERIDKEYLLKRGGIGSVFFEKRGLLIGCGSVGGYIAEELIKSSFLDITIVDSEMLGPENSYRHTCGLAYLDENKAEAVKEKLEKFYPHAKVTAFGENIETLMHNNKIDFSAFDYVVVATGNVTINLFLNEYLSSHHPGIPVFFSWIDPYGIGGHCLITNLKGKGCYNCLYDNEEVSNMASFADKQQTKPFLKSISGCGSVYTPFGSLDAQQTALLTVRKIIDTVKGKESYGAVYSWKGDIETFVAEGYALSPRYQLTERELGETKSAFKSPHCKVCQL